MIDRAIFLSRLEFSVLLMAGGVEEIPCFPLPEEGEVKERDMIEAVYGLVQKNLLKTGTEGLCLVPEIAELTGVLKDAGGYLLVEPGEEGQPQRLVYLESQAVVLENTTDTCPQFRLFLKDPSKLWSWMEETFDLPLPGSGSETEAMEQAGLSDLAAGELERLTGCGHPGPAPGIRFWMDRLEESFGEMPLLGIRRILGRERKEVQDLVVLAGAMNLWVLRCALEEEPLSGREPVVQVVPDSWETRNKIGRWLGREGE